MPLLASIAVKHLLARKRQSVVSLLGIVLGVAFFLAISSLMQGSEKDFIRRLVDNSPHITIEDEFRNPRMQPLQQIYTSGAVELSNVKPVTETRGIRGYEQILESLRATVPGLRASPVLAGQALVSYAGKDLGITLNGMVPEEIRDVTTIQQYMIEGTMDELIANPDGIVIGTELARKLSVKRNDNILIASTTGQRRVFKILGLFRTGRASYDESQAFVSLKRVQALLNRPNRINSIIVKLPTPTEARAVAQRIENRIGYKCVSWQEASEDIMSTLTIRNIIMYTVVSAVLVVAGFGIYNVISTVVMEKHRDIAIMKSMGFHARDIQRIFVIQGAILGACGCVTGLPLGMGLMLALMQIRFKPPGSTEVVQMPIDWGLTQFLIAAGFAMLSAVIAALLPARKGALVQPVDILRGS
ncbi:FtsX-like permease family protein [bacterium]|nr:FtsX-like permease family protein [bacterium]